MKYYFPDDGETIDDARELRKYSGFERPDSFAKEAADFAWGNEDKWEATWPQIIAVVENGIEIARYEVGMEAVPNFYIEKKL